MKNLRSKINIDLIETRRERSSEVDEEETLLWKNYIVPKVVLIK